MTPAFVPVLLYHGVRDAPLQGLERWTTSPALFGEHARAIAAAGRTPLTMAELAACLTGGRPWPEAPVAVTFDDGYDDTLPATETLLGQGIASTTFVQTGRIGAAARLDPAGVRALDALGERVEVGAHTVGHPRVDELSGAALEHEVRGSKDALEQVLGAEVLGFAYPHGAHDRRSRDAVVAAGFAYAAAVKNALSHPGDDPFAIARWTVEADVPASRVEAVLAGRDVPVAWSGERLVTSAYRVVRRLRRRAGLPAA